MNARARRARHRCRWPGFDAVLPAGGGGGACTSAERLGRTELAGRRIWNVNSTARGGGVAEMLGPLLAYARGSGVDARWAVVAGDAAVLHDHQAHPQPAARHAGRRRPARRRRARGLRGGARAQRARPAALVEPGDIVILHDPQTAGLIPRMPRGRAGHLALPRRPRRAERPRARGLVVPRALRAAGRRLRVLARGVRLGGARPGQARDHRAVDRRLRAQERRALAGRAWTRSSSPPACAPAPRAGPSSSGWTGASARCAAAPRCSRRARWRPGERFVLQVSRWDSLKDPIGVIEGFAEHVAPYTDAHLVYAGPDVSAVADDPEGAEVYAFACARWHALPAAARERIHLALLPMEDFEENAVIVNALQRARRRRRAEEPRRGLRAHRRRGDVEARPGGRQPHRRHPGPDRARRQRPAARRPAPISPPTAPRCSSCSATPSGPPRWGEAAHERVRERFLGTHSLLDYLALFERLIDP